MESVTPQWEMSKENAAPLARGRNVKMLEKTFGQDTSPMDKEERQRMLRHYERLVRPSESTQDHDDGNSTADDNDDDPLIHWLSYIKYHQDVCPSDTHQQFLLMERCTRALVKRKRYANDVRFIRVCVMYADKCTYPGDVFKYLHQHKIGSRVALFWVAWAWVAESKGEFAFAEKVFTKGINKGAHPASTLQQRHKQFQRRMNRRLINESQQAALHDDDEEDGGQRNNNRAALGGISHSRIARNDRSQRTNHPSNRGAFTSTFTASSRRSHPPSDNGQKNSFRIYHDDNEENDGAYDLDQSRIVAEGRELERDRDRRKENIMEAERWNERGGYSSSYTMPTSSVRRMEAKPQQPSFSIHVDEALEVKHRQELEAEQERLDRARTTRDERAFRTREQEGMAERLTKDPMRYIVNPSKLRSEQPPQETERSVPRRAGLNCGFDKRLLAKDASGIEQCFEEGRSRVGSYRLLGPSENFNTLRRIEIASSSMDIDESGSIEEVEMEEEENLSFATRQAETPLPPSAFKTRRVLFSLNVSMDNQSKSIILNASTASSTVNEHDAVGFTPAGREEETINTKFAMKELSMMFSSPAMGLGESERPSSSTRNKTLDNGSSDDQDGDGNTAAYSFVAGLLDDDEGNVAVDNSLVRTEKNDRAPFAIKNEEPDVTEGTQEGPSKASGAAFQIFCDSSGAEPEKSPQKPVAKAMPFQIYSDADEPTEEPFKVFKDDERNTTVEAIKPEEGDTALPFQIFVDESVPKQDGSPVKTDSPDTADEDSIVDNGETATYSLFGEAMDALKEMSYSAIDQSCPREVAISSIDDEHTPEDEKDDFTSFRSKDSGAVLNDTAAFGDISRIVADEASRIHLSPTSSSEFKGAAHDYDSLHKVDVRRAIREMSQQAELHSNGRPFTREETDLAVTLSTVGTVLDLPGHMLPRALRKKSSTQGEEISVGNRKGRITQELGRGSYAVVVLLNDSDDTPIAVKAQTPIDCLAWEYTVLKKLGERAQVTNGEAYPFPRPVSFVSLSDGGLLGMSAASSSGLNLVDIVNVYKIQERCPVPELVALHYAVRMLKHVELLHWRGKILHCDIKPDNWVMTASSSAFVGCSTEIIASDLVLVDFGRAIDIEAVEPDSVSKMDVQFRGQANPEDMACVAMRNGWNWSFDIDTFGICASAHVLLYGTHLEIEQDHSTKRWKPRKPLRRYWQKELWNGLFDTLLNVDDDSRVAVGSRPGNLRKIRSVMEEYVQSHSRELETVLRHQARLLPKSKALPG